MKRSVTTLIGALAMGFCMIAHAESPQTYFATSFENGYDDGVSGEAPDEIFTPAAAPGWLLTGDETKVPVAQYDVGEAYPYGEEGRALRREGFSTDRNRNYLNLSTGVETLTRTNENGRVFLDQLVRFTGFEEPQTNLVAGTKIAVWMMGGSLYVSCAKVTESGFEPIVLKIAGEYQLETWYRLTINSLGNIYNRESGLSDSGPRAGFLVYINDKRVSAESEEAKKIICYESEMTDDAKRYMENGQLFPAIDATDTAFNRVGYQGIGAVDDIFLDDEGPEFARQEGRKFTILDKEGVSVASVKTEKGEDVRFQEGVYGPVPNNTHVTITYSPRADYKIMGTNAEDVVINKEGQVVEPSIVVEPIVATVVNGNVTNVYASGELFGMIDGLKVGDVVHFGRECDITNDAGAVLYSVTPNTTITNDTSGWVVNVHDFGEGAENDGQYHGVFKDHVGAASGFSKIFSFASTDGLLNLGGEIAGRIEVIQGRTAVLTNVTIAVSGVLKSANLTTDDASYIVLASGGQVITKNGELTDAQIIADKGMKVVKEEEDGWWIYKSVEAPVARVITDDGATTNEYTSFVAAFTNANTVSDSKIEVFANCSFSNALVSVVPMEIGIEDGVKLRWTGDKDVDPFMIAAALKLTGAGTIEKETDSATLFTVGTGVVDNVEIKMTLDGPTLVTPASQVIKVEYGDLDVLSGVIVNTNAENRAINVLNGHTVTIRGGWITGTITNASEEAESGIVNIPTDTEARFSQPNGFAPSGYEFVEDTDIVGATWYKIAPVIYTIKSLGPGEEIAVDPSEADSKAQYMNEHKSEFLTAPCELPNLDRVSSFAKSSSYAKSPSFAKSSGFDTYASFFTATPNAEKTRIAFLLNDEGANAVVTAEQKASSSALAAVLAASGQQEASMTIDNPLPGFYYSLRQGSSLGEVDFEEGDKNRLADGKKGLTFTLQKPATSGFYQMIVTPVMLPDEE